MYADDTVIFTSGKKIADAVDESQIIFDQVVSWCDQNKLTIKNINEKKTKNTIFNTDSESTKLVTFKDQPLEYVNSYKYLGVDICDDLSWDSFVKNVYRKANYSAYVR